MNWLLTTINRDMKRIGTVLAVATGVVCVGVTVDSPTSQAVVYNPGTVEVDDTSPNISPTVTFTYTLTKDRHGASGENFFMLVKPAGFPDLTAKNCTEIKALVDIYVDGVLKDNSTFIDTGICSAYSGGVQLRLTTGLQLDIGDVVKVVLRPGVLTNPSSSGTTTWIWRTADYTGGDSDWFSASLTTGDTTTTTTLAGPTTTAGLSGGGGGDISGDLGDTGLDPLPLMVVSVGLLVLGVVLSRRLRTN